MVTMIPPASANAKRHSCLEDANQRKKIVFALAKVCRVMAKMSHHADCWVHGLCQTLGLGVQCSVKHQWYNGAQRTYVRSTARLFFRYQSRATTLFSQTNQRAGASAHAASSVLSRSAARSRQGAKCKTGHGIKNVIRPNATPYVRSLKSKSRQ